MAGRNAMELEIARSFPDSEMRDTWKEVYFEPVAGRMLIFPAWLSHEVQPNLTKLKGRAADRISIAFNYIQQLRA